MDAECSHLTSCNTENLPSQNLQGVGGLILVRYKAAKTALTLKLAQWNSKKKDKSNALGLSSSFCAKKCSFKTVLKLMMV